MREEFHKRKCRCRRGEQTVSDAFWLPEEIQKPEYKYKIQIQIQIQIQNTIKNKRGGKGDGEQIVLDTFCLQEKGTKFKSNANDERLNN